METRNARIRHFLARLRRRTRCMPRVLKLVYRSLLLLLTDIKRIESIFSNTDVTFLTQELFLHHSYKL